MKKLQAKLDLGRPPVAEDPAAEAVEDHIEAALEDAVGAPIDFDAFEHEFEQQGELSEASYRLLERAGIPRHIVDRHIEGRLAANEILREEVLAIAGGPERYWRINEWAREMLEPEDYVDWQESLIGDPEDVKAAVEDMSDEYAEATGDLASPDFPAALDGRAAGELRRSLHRPTPAAAQIASMHAAKRARMAQTAAQTPDMAFPPAAAPLAAAPRGQRFQSAEQLAKAIRDPRYRSDPAYRAWVAETVARSDVFGRGGK
ncbi:MAG: hypothetical protein MRY74_05850 [Neomegalonema sp.]|nr:hypothetical protein [Neomegalonema sp.]